MPGAARSKAERKPPNTHSQFVARALEGAGYDRALCVFQCGVAGTVLLSPTNGASQRLSSVVAAEIALVGVAAIWGLTFVMVKDAVTTAPVSAFLAYRFLPAAVIVALAARSDLLNLGREGLTAGVVMGLFLTAGYAFQTAGLQYTSASKAGFITGLFVVLTPMFEALLPGKRALSIATWGAAGLATVGLWLLTGARGAITKGDVLVFLCACSFALHILATNRGASRHSVRALVAVQLAVCGVASLMYSAATESLGNEMTASLWQALAVTAVLASAVGFLVQTYAQRRVSASRTALVLASEPAFAGLFGFLLAGERLGLAGWSGAAVIAAAIVWASVNAEAAPVTTP